MTAQTTRATSTLERIASELEDTAAALRAVLDGTAQDYHLHTIEGHLTGDRYRVTFGSFDDVRCPSCGAPDWTLGKADTQEGFCPQCAADQGDPESCQDWHDHLAEQVDTAAYEGDV